MRTRVIAALVFAAVAGRAAAQTAVPVAPFQSIELRGGGQVMVRAGPQAGIALTQGDARSTRITVQDGWLIVDNCPDRCPEGYRLRAEVTMPEIAALSVSGGGRLIAEGPFQPRPSLGLTISRGGGIDARALEAHSVTASVVQGGRILARPSHTLSGTVEQGGRITYWGRPTVARKIERGGAVRQGSDAEAKMTLAELTPAPPPSPPEPAAPVATVAPVPPR
jgi:putative autotransporter adhesin-like protein